jgi:hypothetical protein
VARRKTYRLDLTYLSAESYLSDRFWTVFGAHMISRQSFPGTGTMDATYLKVCYIVVILRNADQAQDVAVLSLSWRGNREE